MARTTETTRRSKVHRWAEHSDGSSEDYRKSTYHHEVRTEPSEGQHSHHHSSRALHSSSRSSIGGHHTPHRLAIEATPQKSPSSSRSSISGHHTPHRLAIGATPYRSTSNRYDAAALRAPSAVSYGGGPSRKLHPTPSEAVGYAYPGSAPVTSRNLHLQGGGGGGRRVSSTVAPSDSASNVTTHGHGHGHGHGGSRVSSLGGGEAPVRVGEPHGNPYTYFQYCARDGHWTTQTLAQIAGSHGQWYQIPGNPPYFVAV